MSAPVLSAINAVNTELTTLRDRVDIMLAAMGEGEISAAEIQAQIEAATQDAIDSVLTQLDGLDVSSLDRRIDLHKLVLDLKNVYGQEKFLFELFDTAFTVAEFFEQDVVAGIVAGDDSIDIANTANLVVGKEYQVEGGGNREVVVVDSILSGNRFKTVGLMANTYDTTAKVRRTTFDIGTTGQAEATDGQIYYSGEIDLGIVDKDKAVIVRRTDNDAAVRMWFTDESRPTWTEMPWGWIRTEGLPAGYADHEYPCPARGKFRLKIQVEHGPSVQDVTFKHIVGVHEATMQGGIPRPPEKPVNAIPADGAVDVQETPTLGTVGYEHILNAALALTQVQISEAADFSTTIYDGSGGASTMFSTPAGLLATATTYHWRMRFQDENGAWSEWSDATPFTTDSAFQYIVTPNPTSPASGAVEVGETPTLEASVFGASNPTLVDLNASGGAGWTVSGTTAGEYHYGGAACPGKPSQVFIDGAVATEGTLGSLADGEWAWGDQDAIGTDTLYVKIAGGDPDGQATGYIQRGEIHTATQWQIRPAAGTYASPAYDSGEVADLRSHDIPQGSLGDGEKTYYWRLRYRGLGLGLSEWSPEFAFTTKNKFALIIGVALEGPGDGYNGLWHRVDEAGSDVAVTASYFNAHPTYAGIESVVVDGQSMVKIPKFYYKVGLAPEGGDWAGKRCWWVSNAPYGDFKVHPAFYDAGVEVDQIWIGAFQSLTGGDGKGQSQEGVTPSLEGVGGGEDPINVLCENRNVGGVDGFRLWDIFDIGVIKLLMLIENETADMQTVTGQFGGTTTPQLTGSKADAWRGIHDLWSNSKTIVDGLRYRRTPLGYNSFIFFDVAGNRVYGPPEGSGGGVLGDMGISIYAGHLHGIPDAACEPKDFVFEDWDTNPIFLPEQSSQYSTPIVIPDIFFFTSYPPGSESDWGLIKAGLGEDSGLESGLYSSYNSGHGLFQFSQVFYNQSVCYRLAKK